jgi:hypothetical protein
MGAEAAATLGQPVGTPKDGVGMDEVLQLSNDGGWGRGIAASEGHGGEEDPDQVLRLSTTGVLRGQPQL